MAKREEEAITRAQARAAAARIAREINARPEKARKAIWRNCPGLGDNPTPQDRYAHTMRDGCWSCAPFWERVPICPHCGCKLLKVGRTKCKGCGVFVMVEREGQQCEEQDNADAPGYGAPREPW